MLTAVIALGCRKMLFKSREHFINLFQMWVENIIKGFLVQNISIQTTTLKKNSIWLLISVLRLPNKFPETKLNSFKFKIICNSSAFLKRGSRIYRRSVCLLLFYEATKLLRRGIHLEDKQTYLVYAEDVFLFFLRRLCRPSLKQFTVARIGGWRRVGGQRWRGVDDKYDCRHWVSTWCNLPAIQLVIQTVHHNEEI